MKRMTLKQENAYLRRVLLRIALGRAVGRPLAQLTCKRLEELDALRAKPRRRRRFKWKVTTVWGDDPT